LEHRSLNQMDSDNLLLQERNIKALEVARR
jgi:hypothetical protein